MNRALKISRMDGPPGTPKSQPWDSQVPATPGFDYLARYDGETGRLVSWSEVPAAELDGDASKMTWVRVYRDFLVFAIKGKKFGGLVEALTWLYAVSTLKASGVCPVNQSKLAELLGHSGGKTVNRAIRSLEEKGMLRFVGVGTQGERNYVLARGAAGVGRIKR